MMCFFSSAHFTFSSYTQTSGEAEEKADVWPNCTTYFKVCQGSGKLQNPSNLTRTFLWHCSYNSPDRCCPQCESCMHAVCCKMILIQQSLTWTAVRKSFWSCSSKASVTFTDNTRTDPCFLTGNTAGWCGLSLMSDSYSILFAFNSTWAGWDTVATKWSERIVPKICGWEGTALHLKSLFQTEFYVGDIFKNRLIKYKSVFSRRVRSSDTNTPRKGPLIPGFKGKHKVRLLPV